MDPAPFDSRYRWYVLLIATLTNTLLAAAPSMAMPVLFKEISIDLHLDLVQIGVIWGISSLPGIFTALMGGVIGDRFGPKKVLIASCLLVGLTGAARGLSNNFTSLAVTMLLFGTVTPFITINTLKTCGFWFSRQQMGLASGVLSMGMALGFLAGSMLSATVFSPWLGGWRQVLYLYAIIAILLFIPWYLIRLPETAGSSSMPAGGAISLRRNLAQIARIRNVWLFGLAILGISGCIQGTLGYLPLYLRGQGWAPANADGALAAFHTLSMICVIPIALWSDRIGSRKKVLLGAALMISFGVGLLSIAQGLMVWVAVALAGMVRDGFMAVFMTSILETEGVGPAYAGTAIGMVMIFSGLGNLIAPPLGNSLAAIAPSMPFLFWMALTFIGIAGLIGSRERGIKSVFNAA